MQKNKFSKEPTIEFGDTYSCTSNNGFSKSYQYRIKNSLLNKVKLFFGKELDGEWVEIKNNTCTNFIKKRFLVKN